MFCTNCGKQLEDTANYCSICGNARSPSAFSGGGSRDRKSFRRIREGKKIAGVCGGVARYFELDVTLVRILWILFTICPPVPGLIAYIVCWIAMPQDPLPTPSPSTSTVTAQPASDH